MSSTQLPELPKMSSVDEYFSYFCDNPGREVEILEDAIVDLNTKDLDILKKRVDGKKKKLAATGKQKVPVYTPGTSVPGGPLVIDVRDTAAEMKNVDAFWIELEKLDPATLVSQDVLDAFKYIGFDPDVVIKEVLFRGKEAKRTSEEIKKDIVDMVTIAIIKGSVTEKNLQKTSDAGKVMYKKLQDIYKIATGGAKGKDSAHLTVARVAAAVPGIIIHVLIKRPEFSKTFVGPFSSKTLPAYLRHQAAAACIPESTSEKLKDYILGLITAFTADQTKVLAKSKDSAKELFDTQLNYVQKTFSVKHPSEDNRKKIFKNFSLSSDYEKLSIVAAKIKKIKSDFVTLTQAELDEELAK